MRPFSACSGTNGAQALAGRPGLRYRAGLLPDDKIEIVRPYQAGGHTVVMIGDGVNDAPALNADVGIVMGAVGTFFLRPPGRSAEDITSNSFE